MASDAPFELAGHRWDADKKRFFKIGPGQASGTSTGSSSTGSRGKGKQTEQPAARHFASKLRLPAFDLHGTAEGESSSAFAERRVDPVTMRQSAGLMRMGKVGSERARVEAVYSQLALFAARRPLSAHATPDTIIGLQSDLDGFTLLVLHERSVVRIFPNHGISLKLFEAGGPDSLLFLWTGSLRVLCGVLLERWWQQTFLPLSEPKPDRPQRRRNDDDDFYDSDDFDDIGDYNIPYWDWPEIADFMEFDAPVFAAGQAYWAFAETIEAPQDAGVTDSDCRIREVSPERLESRLSFALVVGNKVIARDYEFEVGVRRGYAANCADHRFNSDVMAVAFHPSEEALFCGLRSGRVFVWRQFAHILRDDPTQPVEMPIEEDGSVTNIAIVSSYEMLLVRVNGQVQLVDVVTGQVVRRYQGHVNPYSFTLGFAVDKELRLFALAGLDRRVRVWSLDSALPLGTSATSLPPIYHHFGDAPTSQPLDNDTLYDESSSETFTQAHAASNDNPAMQRGSTLGSTVFPNEVGVLHWHPRYPYEARDPHQVEVVRQEQGADYRHPQQRWKDLFVAAGDWLYQFRFP
ncbi:uncharacterized protein SRS1_16634 [Sporisorium reilianum f. sp. reilianum]|uniref:Uncharacterized protein n=1 Tax=Sporisorium reilianum f. sp. reilianum TaxID=72559 RepID=A0A2N8UNH0_9BASI|nr:uncharacterized protein SRS1_16634 [Sporisorium reilianum f. sp. reilianum]